MRSSRLASVIRKWRTISACMDGVKCQRIRGGHIMNATHTDWPRGPPPPRTTSSRKAQSRGRPIVRAVSRIHCRSIIQSALGRGDNVRLVKSRLFDARRHVLCPRKRTCVIGMSALLPIADMADHSSASARVSNVGGRVRPRTLAVVRLITSSNVVGCWTGRSPGFAPRRILSTYSAAFRNKSK